MNTRHKTRSSVLGKRPISQSPPSSPTCDMNLPTPDPTPNAKRVKSTHDDDANKENVAPNLDSPVSRTRTHTLPTPPTTPESCHPPLHSRARSFLRSASNNIFPVARDSEHAFIRSFLHATNSVSLYISGSPGTGKTALVNSILGDQHPNVVSINCMALDSFDALCERLSQEFPLTNRPKGKKISPKDSLQRALAGLSTQCILVLDELDHIASTPQSLNSIFSAFQSWSSTLRVIGIANTHTLTSLPLSSSIQTIHFTPYSPPQLLTILQSRLSSLDSEELNTFLPLPTLTLLTKKIAAQTGDVRALFEVLRAAIDLAILPANTTPTVTPTHVLRALKASTPSRSASITSEIVTKAKNLGFQARLVLLAILLGSKRLDAGLSLTSSSPSKASGMDMSTLHTYYATILTRAGNEVISPVGRSEFADLVGVLEGCGLVGLSSASPSRGFKRSTSFGNGTGGKSGEVRLGRDVRGDEVGRGLGVGGLGGNGDVVAEEVRGVWEREGRRLARELKSRLATKFEDAMDD